MVQTREVVITGLGVVSPIGIGKDAFWTALLEGVSGVRSLDWFRGTQMPVRFGAEVADFDGKRYVKPRKSLKVMSREIQYGFAAASQAMEDAGLEQGAVEPERLGVVFGSEMYYCDIGELEDVYRSCMVDGRFDYGLWGERAMSQLYPLWMLKYLPNMVACHIGIAHDARGPNNSITLGDVSSLLALQEAVSVIERGHADVIITGGAGSRLSLTPWLYRGDSNLSHRNEDPAAASRPFDAGRDGMVNGEGAAALVLESRRHAEARGARLLGRVLGAGSSYGAVNDPRQPPRAICNAIGMALRAAHLEPADVGHINAHGASTVEGDVREAQAIGQCLGDVPVTAPKSFFGNLGAAGGAVEMVVSLLALKTGQLPVTLNYQQPDPRCPIRVVHDRPYRLDQPTALLLNQAPTGQAAAVLVAKA